MTTSVGNRVPAAALSVVGGASMYLGAALAVVLFDWLSPIAVAMLRLVDAAVVPAEGGVALIVDVRWSGSPEGMLWALVASALWAVYIVLGKRVASGGAGLDDLAVGFAVAATVLAPASAVAGSLGLAAPAHPLGLAAPVHPLVLLSAVGVGVLSGVVPYALDQLVLRRVGQARFAVLLAVLPATAAVLGAVTLAQVPGTSEAVGSRRSVRPWRCGRATVTTGRSGRSR